MSDQELRDKLASEGGYTDGPGHYEGVAFRAGWDAARANPRKCNVTLTSGGGLWECQGEILVSERDLLCAEVDKLKETLSYLPKIPTQPYEKRLAQECNKLKSENQSLSIKLQRTVHAAYRALLEMSAWLGIPEKKRSTQIANFMENVKYCAEHDLRKMDESQEIIRLKTENESLKKEIERLKDAAEAMTMLYIKS